MRRVQLTAEPIGSCTRSGQLTTGALEFTLGPLQPLEQGASKSVLVLTQGADIVPGRRLGRCAGHDFLQNRPVQSTSSIGSVMPRSSRKSLIAAAQLGRP